MASSQTEHLGLNQWAGEDAFVREEFNADNRIVDEHLSRKCEALFGSYHGDGSENRVIPLGCTPNAVLVKNPENYLKFAYNNEMEYSPALAVRGVQGNTLNIVEGGFVVSSHGLVNHRERSYVYIAFV